MDEEEMDRTLAEILLAIRPGLYEAVAALLSMGQTKNQIMAKVHDQLSPGNLIEGIVESTINHIRRTNERRNGEGADGEDRAADVGP